MKRIVLFLLAILISFLVLFLLNQSSYEADRVELKINRFEKELFLIDSANVIEKSNQWDQK